MENLEQAPKKYIIMCVGHTHSGKTTFAKKLVEDNKNIVIIDNDVIADFIATTYPTFVKSDYNKSKKTLEDPNLKFLLWKQVLNFGLATGQHIILSNGNLGKDIRDYVRGVTDKNKYNLVTVYFNLPRDVLVKRIEKTNKDTAIFITSKNWSQVFDNQETYAVLPPDKDTSYYFEINDPSEADKVLISITQIIAD